ncbi:MAG: hypothetical protein ACAI44_21040, partial [Candidatus Sericytochromatia bacterium]
MHGFAFIVLAQQRQRQIFGAASVAKPDQEIPGNRNRYPVLFLSKKRGGWAMWIQPELSADEERLHKLILERGLVPEQQLKELLGQRQELVKQAIEQL